MHILFIAVIALLVLGPKRLPELARALGKGVREFRETVGMGTNPARDLLSHVTAQPAAEQVVSSPTQRVAETPDEAQPAPPAGQQPSAPAGQQSPAPAGQQPPAPAGQQSPAPADVDPVEPLPSVDAPDRRPL